MNASNPSGCCERMDTSWRRGPVSARESSRLGEGARSGVCDAAAPRRRSRPTGCCQRACSDALEGEKARIEAVKGRTGIPPGANWGGRLAPGMTLRRRNGEVWSESPQRPVAGRGVRVHGGVRRGSRFGSAQVRRSSARGTQGRQRHQGRRGAQGHQGRQGHEGRQGPSVIPSMAEILSAFMWRLPSPARPGGQRGPGYEPRGGAGVPDYKGRFSLRAGCSGTTWFVGVGADV